MEQYTRCKFVNDTNEKKENFVDETFNQNIAKQNKLKKIYSTIKNRILKIQSQFHNNLPRKIKNYK